ncbi:unnamed protein product [Diplocarpon coronariae]
MDNTKLQQQICFSKTGDRESMDTPALNIWRGLFDANWLAIDLCDAHLALTLAARCPHPLKESHGQSSPQGPQIRGAPDTRVTDLASDQRPFPLLAPPFLDRLGSTRLASICLRVSAQPLVTGINQPQRAVRYVTGLLSLPPGHGSPVYRVRTRRDEVERRAAGGRGIPGLGGVDAGPGRLRLGIERARFEVVGSRGQSRLAVNLIRVKRTSEQPDSTPRLVQPKVQRNEERLENRAALTCSCPGFSIDGDGTTPTSAPDLTVQQQRTRLAQRIYLPFRWWLPARDKKPSQSGIRLPSMNDVLTLEDTEMGGEATSKFVDGDWAVDSRSARDLGGRAAGSRYRPEASNELPITCWWTTPKIRYTDILHMTPGAVNAKYGGAKGENAIQEDFKVPSAVPPTELRNRGRANGHALLLPSICRLYQVRQTAGRCARPGEQPEHLEAFVSEAGLVGRDERWVGVRLRVHGAQFPARSCEPESTSQHWQTRERREVLDAQLLAAVAGRQNTTTPYERKGTSNLAHAH